MKKLKISFIAAGTALILLTGCVSSRKYKASQADVAKLKGDSAQLQQQVTTLNGSVQDLQGKNTALQQSLDNTNNNLTAQQKHLDYYQSYFKEQQQAMSQVSDDVKGALTQAGINNADVEQVGSTVYVRMDENELFKKNTTIVTPGGKKALDNLSQVIANKSNVNVFVASGDSAVAGSTAGMPMDNDPAPKPMHHRIHHTVAAGASGTAQGGGAQASASVATNNNNGAAPAHKKIHHHYSSESSTAVYTGPGMHNHAWALKQGRMVTVANHFLKGGVPKIHVSLQQPPADGSQPSNTIKVIFTPKMEDFNPQTNASATR